MLIYEPHNPNKMVDLFKAPLGIIRSYSDHLLEAYEQLSPQQRLLLIEAIQSQTRLLEYLLDDISHDQLEAHLKL